MLARILYATALAAAVPIVAHGAEQFDLVCRGTTSGSGLGSAAAERRYRIDLSSRKWCARECLQIFPIADLTDDRIVLKHSNVHSLYGDIDEDFYIDRKHNKAYEMQGALSHGVAFSGDCIVDTFSGFPNPHF